MQHRQQLRKTECWATGREQRAVTGQEPEKRTEGGSCGPGEGLAGAAGKMHRQNLVWNGGAAVRHEDARRYGEATVDVAGTVGRELMLRTEVEGRHLVNVRNVEEDPRGTSCESGRSQGFLQRGCRQVFRSLKSRSWRQSVEVA